MHSLSIPTPMRECMVDISRHVHALVAQNAWQKGVLVLFCPHTTCGLTINEGADPDVVRDLTCFFSTLAPQRNNWSHAEGNSDAHIKSSLLGCSLHVLVDKGQLQLGTWQSVYLYEGDGPRSRTVWAQWLGAAH